MRIFDWRKVICSKHGPKSSTTRHVLLTLSIFMDADGQNCFPSTRKLSESTGLSLRVICVHLKIAEQTGWIKISVRGLSGQGWKRHKYDPEIPADVLTQSKHLNDKALTQSKHLNAEGAYSNAEGADFKDKKVLTQSKLTRTDTNPDIEAKKPTRQKSNGATLPPDEIEFTDTHRRLARESDLSLADEWNRYVDWAHSKGEKRVDHSRAFNNWVRRSGDFKHKVAEPTCNLPELD